MDDGLDRFVDAQERSYDGALAEMRRGRKTSHWMWYVFPQIRGLGMSPTAQHFGVRDIDEARAYLAHPVLGPRLREITEVVAASPTPTAEQLMGRVDAMKLRSSMTLFARAAQADGADGADGAADDERLFLSVLKKYYAGVLDDATLKRL